MPQKAKPNRKSQSALEYMMTYGWAILIIVIVAGVLYSLGIFTPSLSASPTVTGFNGLGSVQAECSAYGLEIILGNSLGVTINITEIKAVQSGQISTKIFPAQSSLPSNYLISPQGSSKFIILNVCPNSTSRFSAQVYINYTEPGQPLSGPYNANGVITGQSTNQYNLYGADLIGDWPFDEGSGSTAHDISLLHNAGSLTSTVTWQSSNCKFNDCLNFSNAGSSRLVTIPNTFQMPNTGYTLASWVYVQKDPVSSDYYLAGITSPSADGFYVGASTGDNFFQVRVNTLNSYVGCTSTYSFVPDTWYFVVYSFNGTYLTVYVDGQQTVCPYSGTPDSLNTGFQFGDYANIGSADFNGSMDNPMIWNVSLTQREVSALYQSFFYT